MLLLLLILMCINLLASGQVSPGQRLDSEPPFKGNLSDADRCSLVPKSVRQSIIVSRSSLSGRHLQNRRMSAFHDIKKYMRHFETPARAYRQCDLDSRLVEAASAFAKFYDLGNLSANACGTLYRPFHVPVADLRLSLLSARLMAWTSSSFITGEVLNTSGSDEDKLWPTGWATYGKGHRYCDIVGTTTLRIRGKWAYWSTLATGNPSRHMESGKRILVSEAVYMDREARKQRNMSATLRLPKCKSTETSLIGKAVLQKRGGTAGLSAFQKMPLEENLALKAALEAGEEDEQAAIDSSLPSNLAIIVLPMVLAAVPLALFADVSTGLTLAYTVATDIVSVLPAIIKGVELVVYGSRSTSAVRTHFFGPEVKEGLIICETWVAHCIPDENFHLTGVLLLSAAVAVMITGVAWEFYAKRRVDELKAKESRKQQENLDMVNGSIFEYMLSAAEFR